MFTGLVAAFLFFNCQRWDCTRLSGRFQGHVPFTQNPGPMRSKKRTFSIIPRHWMPVRIENVLSSFVSQRKPSTLPSSQTDCFSYKITKLPVFSQSQADTLEVSFPCSALHQYPHQYIHHACILPHGSSFLRREVLLPLHP